MSKQYRISLQAEACFHRTEEDYKRKVKYIEIARRILCVQSFTCISFIGKIIYSYLRGLLILNGASEFKENYLNEHGQLFCCCSYPDIANALNIAPNTVRKQIQALSDIGMVRIENWGNEKKIYLICLETATIINKKAVGDFYTIDTAKHSQSFIKLPCTLLENYGYIKTEALTVYSVIFSNYYIEEDDDCVVMSRSELAKKCGIAYGRLTAILEKLADNGLIRYVTDVYKKTKFYLRNFFLTSAKKDDQNEQKKAVEDESVPKNDENSSKYDEFNSGKCENNSKNGSLKSSSSVKDNGYHSFQRRSDPIRRNFHKKIKTIHPSDEQIRICSEQVEAAKYIKQHPEQNSVVETIVDTMATVGLMKSDQRLSNGKTLSLSRMQKNVARLTAQDLDVLTFAYNRSAQVNIDGIKSPRNLILSYFEKLSQVKASMPQKKKSVAYTIAEEDYAEESALQSLEYLMCE